MDDLTSQVSDGILERRRIRVVPLVPAEYWPLVDTRTSESLCDSLV